VEIINVRFPKKVVDDLDRLTSRFNVNRSEIIRQALIIYLNLVQNMGKFIRPTIFEVNPNQISYLRRGDVSILKIPTGHAIVVGSASSGAIGPKELDEVKVSGKVLGKFLARVALMDVAATGAYPLLLSITLGVEKNPTGHYIEEGIAKEVRILGIESNNVIMVNTEENFGSKQTGAGVTAIGFANETNLRIGKTKPNDLVVAIGLPRIGAEVLPAEARREIADLKDMMSLAQNHFVHDILPVGAFGIESDARMMAQTIGRQLKLNSECKIDLNKSAGPATVILVTLGKDKLDDITWLYKRPINIIGKID
jgi:hypothetical protein